MRVTLNALLGATIVNAIVANIIATVRASITFAVIVMIIAVVIILGVQGGCGSESFELVRGRCAWQGPVSGVCVQILGQRSLVRVSAVAVDCLLAGRGTVILVAHQRATLI